MFKVVKRTHEPRWFPVLQGETIYVGQLVSMGLTTAGYGVKALGAASGAGGVGSDVVPWGVVTGINNKVMTYNSTYHTYSTLGVQSQASQVARITSPAFVGVEGFSKADPMPYVLVDRLDSTTQIKGTIFNATYGTAITKYTNTTQSTTGAAVTTAAVGNTPLGYNKILYAIDGKNAGLYRGEGSGTSTTSHVPDTYWPYDVEVGDKFKIVFLSLGTVKAQFDTASTCIIAEPDCSSNYWWLDVDLINLEKDGEEYAIFRFNPLAFLGVR